MPFILLGLAIVTLFFGLILFAYLFIFGAIVGVILFALAWIRQYFFPAKHIIIRQPPPDKKGRTFEHKKDDLDQNN